MSDTAMTTEVDQTDVTPPNFEKSSVRTAAEKTTLRVKSTENKALAEKVKNVFLAPFVRSMRFLYSGLSTRSDVFILGTHKEPKDNAPVKRSMFRYGDPDEALALVCVKDPVLLQDLHTWLLAVGVDIARFEVIVITEICSVLNKCKWDMSRLSSHRDDQGQLVLSVDAEPGIVVSESIQTYFAFQKIRDLANLYTQALVEKTVRVYSHDYRGDDQQRLSKVVISTDDLKQNGFTQLPDHGQFRVLLTRGLDWLYVKDLPPCTNDGFLGLYIWHLSGSSFAYMHVYDTAQITLACTRCNFFLIPYTSQPLITSTAP